MTLSISGSTGSVLQGAREYPWADSILLRQRDRDVPVLHSARVIALNVDRPRLGFVAVERAAGDAGDLLVIDRLHAVPHDRDAPPDQRDIEAFPRSRLARQRDRGREKAVDCADGVKPVVFVDGLVFYLDFVPPAQIDAAVAVRRAIVLDVQLEIVERAGGADVRALALVNQLARARHPVIIGGVADGLPAGQVLAVEDGFGIGPGLGHRAVELGRSHAGQLAARFFAALHRSGERIAARGELPRGRRAAAAAQRDRELVAIR